MSIAPQKRPAEGAEPQDSSDLPTEPVNKKIDRVRLQDKYKVVSGGWTTVSFPPDKHGVVLGHSTYSGDYAKAKLEGKEVDSSVSGCEICDSSDHGTLQCPFALPPFTVPHCEICKTDGHCSYLCLDGPPLVSCKLCNKDTDHVTLNCPYAEERYGVVPQEDGTYVHCTDRCFICNKVHDGEPDFDNCPYSDDDIS